MVRISDILRRGRDEEEPRKKKSEEQPKEQPKEPPREKPQEQPQPPKEHKEFFPHPQPPSAAKKDEPSPASYAEIARVVMEKTKAGRPKSEELYQDLILLIKDVLAKGARNQPISLREILLKVDRAIDQMSIAGEELIELTNNYSAENYLYAHAVNVCLLAIKLGIGLGFNKSKLTELGVSGLLYDIGMIKVIDMAHKPSKLTREEYAKVKEHPLYGVEILKQVKDLSDAVIYVTDQHHERMDGTGYPHKFANGQINEYAQIIALVDMYEALSHPRPYRKRLLPHQVMKEIIKNKEQFQQRLVKTLIEEVGIYPIGSWVELNSGEIGKVAKINKNYLLQPTVNVVIDHDGRRLKDLKPVELVQHPTIYIKRPLDESEIQI